MAIRTSLTHPLEIDYIKIANGEIGMTICPGKHGPSYYGDSWERDLRSDLEVVVHSGATTLVTLMEDHELQKLKVEELGYMARQLGLEWFHLPITDLSVPGPEFEAQWQESGKKLREKLQAGERIVLHCRGGLGRTGTIAARLAIELGWNPKDALLAIREARRGTVETIDQENYVLRQKSLK